MAMDRHTFTIRSQWRQRPETALQAATRLAGLLLALSDVHPGLKHWFKKSSNRPSQLPFCRMPPEVNELEAILKDGAQFKDTVPPEPWPERGFHASAWNGVLGNDASASFSLKIGAHVGKLAAFNRFELVLTDAPVEGSLISTEVIRAISAAIIAEMEPSCLDVTSNKWLHEAPMDLDLTCPAGGWMSYVKDRRDFDPPEGMSVQSMGDGIMVSATSEIFSDARPEHVDAANRLNEALVSVRTAENELASQPNRRRVSSI